MTVIEQQIPAGTWQADKIHSSIGFAVKHSGVATFRGTFSDYDGTLTVARDGEPQLTGVVRAASVDVRDQNLAGHLQSPDFFDVERTPEIRFTSTAFRPAGDGSVIVDGELTIKGQTRAVEARGSITPAHEGLAGNLVAGIQLETVIDRTAFGLNWNAPLPSGGVALANDVKLIVDLELAKRED
jgi:polyisoprenoid-binding protein YceI